MKTNQLIPLILSHIYGLSVYSIIPYSSPFTSLLFSTFFKSIRNMRSRFRFKTSTIQFSTRSRLVPCVSVTIQSLILKCIRIITRLLYTGLFGLWFLRLRLLLIYWERKTMFYDWKVVLILADKLKRTPTSPNYKWYRWLRNKTWYMFAPKTKV